MQSAHRLPGQQQCQGALLPAQLHPRTQSFFQDCAMHPKRRNFPSSWDGLGMKGHMNSMNLWSCVHTETAASLLHPTACCPTCTSDTSSSPSAAVESLCPFPGCWLPCSGSAGCIPWALAGSEPRGLGWGWCCCWGCDSHAGRQPWGQMAEGHRAHLLLCSERRQAVTQKELVEAQGPLSAMGLLENL